jgi:hypothetical protein
VPRDSHDVIELRAVNPDGDLACDFTLANEMARRGLREALAAGIVPPPRPIDGGVEVTLTPESWDAVARYVDLESRCCSFLDLSARRAEGAILLRVTGRPDARDFIANIFADHR